MKKVMRIIGIVILVLIVLIAALLAAISKTPAVPEDYTKTIKTRGSIEENYMAIGPYDVEYFESSALMSFKKYEIFYPKDIKSIEGKLPVVIFVNGTGVKGSKYPAFILGSTGDADKAIAPMESLTNLYNNIPDNTVKLLARRNDADHGTMLYYGDGYVTAWFMWHLMNDENAAKAFAGEVPELIQNAYYQDVKTNLQ